jgi:NAD-dependent dihydropyrimidine dehydrogenase PreA subunit
VPDTIIQIDKSLCVGCGGCNEFCPEGILDVNEGLATVVNDLLDKCLECGECEEYCPEKAVKVITG